MLIHVNFIPDANPAKKFRYSFSNPQSNQQNHSNRLVKMEVLSYLNAPATEEENDLSQLNNFSNIRRIFMKFNALLTSMATANPLFPVNSKRFCWWQFIYAIRNDGICYLFSEICNALNFESMPDEAIEHLVILNNKQIL